MKQSNAAPHWIAVDWSESGMRAWAMDNQGLVLMKVRSAQGLAQIAVDAFETVLFNLVRPWLIHDSTPVVASGLTGALRETTLLEVPIPCRPAELAAHPVETADDRLNLLAVPGLKHAESGLPGIAHDSLIRGIAAEMPEFSGAVCIPDAQTQWVEMKAGEVIGVQAFLTAGLTDMLSAQRAELLPDPVPDAQVFATAVVDAFDRPDLTTQRIIPARSDDDPAKSRLKGLLIGAELAGSRELWHGTPVLVVDESPWSGLYEQALSRLGATVLPCARDAMSLAGLRHAYLSLSETIA